MATELDIADDAIVQRRWPASRAWAGASSATASCPASDGGSVHRDRRLRPPPGGDGGHAWPPRAVPSRSGAWCWPSSRTATAAPAICFEDFVKVLGQADARAADRGLRRRRGADGGSRWPFAAPARCAWRATVEPAFRGARGANCRQTIADDARDGDVVMCHGRWFHGLVAGQVVDLLQNSELAALAGKRR